MKYVLIILITLTVGCRNATEPTPPSNTTDSLNIVGNWQGAYSNIYKPELDYLTQVTINYNGKYTIDIPDNTDYDFPRHFHNCYKLIPYNKGIKKYALISVLDTVFIKYTDEQINNGIITSFTLESKKYKEFLFCYKLR